MDYLPIKTLYLEVTHACNQRCRHCYLDGGMHHQTAEMSTEQIKHIIKEFQEQGGSYLIITGGEPVVRKDIFEILDYAEKLNIPFNFASNGLAMTPERLEKLAGYRCLDMYFTSILGANARQHKDITQRDSYDKVMEALEFLDSKGIFTYVQVTLAKEYLNEIEEIGKKLLDSYNCMVKFTPIAALGSKSEEEKEESKALIITKEYFSLFLQKVEALNQRYPERIDKSNIQNYDQIKAMISDYQDEPLYSLSYGFLAVRPNGDMSFSCNMDNPYTFGKAYESIRIPADEKLFHYIDILKTAEQQVLRDSRENIVEVDVLVDYYIKKQRYESKKGV